MQAGQSRYDLLELLLVLVCFGNLMGVLMVFATLSLPGRRIGRSSLILYIQMFSDMAFMPSGQDSVKGSLDMWSPSRSSMIWLSCLLSTSSMLHSDVPIQMCGPHPDLLCSIFNLQSSMFSFQSSMLWLSCLLSTGSVLGPLDIWSPFRSSIMWLLCLLSKGL